MPRSAASGLSVALAGGAHELSLKVSAGDGYGVEIDLVTVIRETSTATTLPLPGTI